MTEKKVLYGHPIDMQSMYVDSNPTRKDVLALSPNPDTIPFYSYEQVVNFTERLGLFVEQYNGYGMMLIDISKFFQDDTENPSEHTVVYSSTDIAIEGYSLMINGNRTVEKRRDDGTLLFKSVPVVKETVTLIVTLHYDTVENPCYFTVRSVEEKFSIWNPTREHRLPFFQIKYKYERSTKSCLKQN